MYFDPRPKEFREDFYDRERELKNFIHNLSNPLTLILGLRRSGKTSLLLVGLNESKLPYIIIDCRNLPVNPSKKDVILAFEKGFNEMIKKHRKIWSSIKEYLRLVEGVKILSLGVSFSWEKTSSSFIISEINNWARDHDTRVIIAFDEFQQIRGAKDILTLIAHTYDYKRNISIVLTGSEMGLLYDTVKIDDPKASLYGRYIYEIRLENFTKEQAMEFLLLGFQQCNIKPNMEILEYAVEKFNGIPGWLTFFGAEAINRKHISKNLVDEIFEKASLQALEEIKNFLKYRIAAEKRYRTILKTIASGRTRWSEIKRSLEISEGRKLPSPTITNLLKNLVKTSIIKEENGSYTFMDPIVENAAKKL